MWKTEGAVCFKSFALKDKEPEPELPAIGKGLKLERRKYKSGT
jgi:hypothetical protein